MRDSALKWIYKFFGIHMWTLEHAVEFLREIDPSLKEVGYSVGLTGSNLIKGKSFDDLDVIVYPLSSVEADVERAKGVLRNFGMKVKHEKEDVQSHWRKKGSLDSKHVEVWTILDKRWHGKRVDVFFLQ